MIYIKCLQEGRSCESAWNYSYIWVIMFIFITNLMIDLFGVVDALFQALQRMDQDMSFSLLRRDCN